MVSFTDAAYIILKTEGKPMHARDICQKALAQRLIKTQGKTPIVTMGASLYLEKQHRLESKRKPRFKLVGPNIWELDDSC